MTNFDMSSYHVHNILLSITLAISVDAKQFKDAKMTIDGYMTVDEISSQLMVGFIQLGRMEEHIIDMGKKRWVERGGGRRKGKWDMPCLMLSNYDIFSLQCMYPYYCNLEKARKWATSWKPCLYP